MSNLEQTLSIIKPDAVERNLVEKIRDIFIKNDLKIKDSKKFMSPKKKLQNFTRYISLNHSTMIYAHTFLQVL